MEIRPARIPDARAICEIVNAYAERGRMLHRNLESVYATLRDFHVAEQDGRIVGCVAVAIFWADLGEIRSLAVRGDLLGRGVGSQLLRAAITSARALGLRRLFALTYETPFFRRHGFEVIDRNTLPEKVWRECIACPKADCCDEIAMMLQLAAPAEADPTEAARAP